MNTNIPKRCRVCTSRNTQMMSIFERYNFSERNLQVFEVITKCAAVQIRKLDGFSEQICNQCLEHLSQAFSFKQLCEDSDYKFRHNLIVEERIVSQDAHCEKEANIQHCDNNDNNINEEVDCISSDVIFEIKNESSEGETKNQDGLAGNELLNEDVRISTDLKEFFAEDTKIFYGNSQLQNENDTNSTTRELQNGIDALSGNLSQTIATTFQENRQICDTDLILAQNRAKIHVNEVNNCILNISVDVSSDEESGVDAEEIESEHDFSNEQEENVRKTSTSTFQDLHLQSTIMPKENSQISRKGKNLEEENSHIIHGIDELSAQNQAKIHVNEVNNGRLNISEDVSSDEESGVDAEEIESEHDFSNEQKENVRKTSSRTFQDLHLQSTIMPNENSQISRKGKNLEEENSHICTYFNRTILNNHRGIDKERYKCKVCGKYYKCKPALIRLERLHFSGTTNNESAIYNSDMSNHTGPIKCETCGKIFTQKYTLSRHMKIHTGEQPFKCETCGKSFKQKGNLRKHVRVHTGKKAFKCVTCEKSFRCKMNLNRHIRIHTGEKPFKCEICDKSFALKITLKDHLRIHTGEQPFKCETCGKSFKQKGNLRKHVRIHTGEKPFKSETCGKSFKQKGNLRKHVRIHTGKKAFKCMTCEKSFRCKMNLKRHMRIHTGEKPFKCETCDKSFALKITLKDHLRIHTGEQPFKCETCGKSFKQKGNLRNHVRIHTGEKPFKCGTCDKSFALKITLKDHLRIHTGEQPFKCETCGKSFKQKGNLRNHVKIHTGEKPFKCGTCDKSFALKITLKDHLRIHTGEQPFKCETCGKSFKQKGNLRKHVRIHMGEKPFKCETCGKSFSSKPTLNIHLGTHTEERDMQ